jgi:hypothetical protein
MKQELDKLLCEKYPKLFVNRHAPMQETCMCWGFDVGDGWFNIIDQLCGNIQHHIDWRERQVKRAIAHNEMVAQCKAGNFELFEAEMTGTFTPTYIEERKQELINGGSRLIPETCPQVTVDQVKEKFGTLRFYYTGGNEYIAGLVTMAESMSGFTCEQCSNPAVTGGTGWIHTTCVSCNEKREAAREKHA